MERVLAYLKKNKSRFIDELIEYVSIPSVSAQPKHKADMERAARWIASRAETAGLSARIVPTKGHPVMLATSRRRKGYPHYVVYGHYDVQPPEPFELWKSAPFTPVIKGKALFGRGSSDNKGQHMAHLRAIEAYHQTGTELPCDVTFLIEGEEEVGSSNLSEFLKKNRKALDVDAVVISDTGIPRIDQPALTYALRGIVALFF